MALRLVVGCALSLGLALGGGACAVVLGTSDLEACEGDCGGGGGAGGGDPSSSSPSVSQGADASTGSSGVDASSSVSASSGSTSTGSPCGHLVTLTYEGITGEGEVRIDLSPDGVDFDEGVSSHCLPPGEKRFDIECRSDDDELDDHPLVVSWGNERCADGASCTFQLDSDQTFTLTGSCD